MKYRVDSRGWRYNNVVLDISHNNFRFLMATIDYHLEITWLPPDYHMVTARLSLGYSIDHMYARSSGKNIF